MRAATACARSASGAKEAGISAATTPGSQSAMVVSMSASPHSAVMGVAPSGATLSDTGTDGAGGEASSPAGASVTASHGISSDSATSSSDSRKTLRIRTASFLPRGAFCSLTQRGNQYKIGLLNMYWDR